MLIYDSKHFELYYDQQNSIFENRWKGNEHLSDEDFKSNLLEYAQLAEKHRPKNYLVDNSTMDFIISPDLQDWVTIHVYPKTSHSDVKKFALVISPDIFTAVSVEQVVDEGADKFEGVQTRYFDKREDALKWILEA